MKKAKPIVIAAVLISLSACAGQESHLGNGTMQPRPAVELSQIARTLPSPTELRSISILMSFSQTGSQALMRDSSALDEATSLRLPSAPGSMSWAVWGFPYGQQAMHCEVAFGGDAGAQSYFAVSDYSRGVWQISGPYEGPLDSVSIGNAAWGRSDGAIFVAVIAFDGANILVDQLTMVADISPFQLPVDNSGGYTSLSMVNGYPAMSFYDDTNQVLRYAIANDIFGASWGPSIVVDSAADTGMHTSLAVVDGNPAIAYYSFSLKRLRYVRANDARGEVWGSPMSPDSGNSCGEYCSLDVVDGFPAISYYSSDIPALRYIRALDSTGSTWGTPVSVDTDGNTGQETCLEVVNGFPAIAYRKGAAGELRYVRALDSSGAVWAEPKVLQSGHNSGYSNSLVVVNGQPAIATYDLSDSALLYFRATDQLGDNWPATGLMLDGETEDIGSHCSMAVISGRPCISYHSGLHGDLRFIAALDGDGTSWASPLLVDESSVIVGKYTSLCSVYGIPGISYYDQTNGTVRYCWGCTSF